MPLGQLLAHSVCNVVCVSACVIYLLSHLARTNLLFACHAHEHVLAAKEIGGHLNLNASTVSGIVSRLEKKGYLAKLPNHEDKRSVYIYLTALGEKIVGSIPDLLHEKLTKKLKSLSDQDLEELQSSLSLLVSFMQAEDVDASPLLTPGDTISSI